MKPMSGENVNTAIELSLLKNMTVVDVKINSWAGIYVHF